MTDFSFPPEIKAHLKTQNIISEKTLKAALEKILADSKDQAEAILKIYDTFIPDWDNVEKVDGWPQTGPSLTAFFFLF